MWSLAHLIRYTHPKYTMSPSSTGGSPRLAAATSNTTSSTARPFPVPSSRGNFSIDMPTPGRTTTTNGSSGLKSPTTVKSQRQASFSRERILGSVQKARDTSQSSENRPESISSLMQQKDDSEESLNPLKRRNTDVGVDYPRRRATIACEVCRSRKSRCDGTKPKCKLCTELSVTLCILQYPRYCLSAYSAWFRRRHAPIPYEALSYIVELERPIAADPC